MTSRAWVLAVATAAVALAVLVAGLSPEPPPGTELASDSVWHGLAYLVLAGLVSRTAAAMGAGRGVAAAAAFAFALGHGALLEVLQRFTVTRTPELRDLAADAVGAAVGVVLAALLGART